MTTFKPLDDHVLGDKIKFHKRTKIACLVIQLVTISAGIIGELLDASFWPLVFCVVFMTMLIELVITQRLRTLKTIRGVRDE